MKGDSILKKIIYSSFFLAAVPAILVMFFLPSMGSKSRLLVEQVDKISSINVYSDLNSDSISEVVRSGKGNPYFHILVLNNDMRVYDQWNLQDSMDLVMSDFFFGNYDHDLFKEIYAFTYKDDSLFLNINEFFDKPGMKLDRLYITNIRVINKKVTSIIWPAGFYDSGGLRPAKRYNPAIIPLRSRMHRCRESYTRPANRSAHTRWWVEPCQW